MEWLNTPVSPWLLIPAGVIGLLLGFGINWLITRGERREKKLSQLVWREWNMERMRRQHGRTYQ